MMKSIINLAFFLLLFVIFSHDFSMCPKREIFLSAAYVLVCLLSRLAYVLGGTKFSKSLLVSDNDVILEYLELSGNFETKPSRSGKFINIHQNVIFWGCSIKLL